MAVFDLAIITSLWSSYSEIMIACSEAEKMTALSFIFSAIIPLENHGFGDRPFLPFEVGRARANAIYKFSLVEINHMIRMRVSR